MRWSSTATRAQSMHRPCSIEKCDVCRHLLLNRAFTSDMEIHEDFCHWNVVQNPLMADIVKTAFNVAFQHPFWWFPFIQTGKALLDSVLYTSFQTGKLFPTDLGSPQGSSISPTICNMVLDGLEAQIKKKYHKRKVNGKAQIFLLHGRIFLDYLPYLAYYGFIILFGRFKWIAKKYFKRIGTRSWTFSVKMPDSFELNLIYATDTNIVRWLKTKSEATPFDDRFTGYFEERDTERMFREIKGRKKLNALYKAQKGICPICGGAITRWMSSFLCQSVWNISLLSIYGSF